MLDDCKMLWAPNLEHVSEVIVVNYRDSSMGMCWLTVGKKLYDAQGVVWYAFKERRIWVDERGNRVTRDETVWRWRKRRTTRTTVDIVRNDGGWVENRNALVEMVMEQVAAREYKEEKEEVRSVRWPWSLSLDGRVCGVERSLNGAESKGLSGPRREKSGVWKCAEETGMTESD